MQWFLTVGEETNEKDGWIEHEMQAPCPTCYFKTSPSCSCHTATQEPPQCWILPVLEKFLPWVYMASWTTEFRVELAPHSTFPHSTDLSLFICILITHLPHLPKHPPGRHAHGAALLIPCPVRTQATTILLWAKSSQAPRSPLLLLARLGQ